MDGKSKQYQWPEFYRRKEIKNLTRIYDTVKMRQREKGWSHNSGTLYSRYLKYLAEIKKYIIYWSAIFVVATEETGSL